MQNCNRPGGPLDITLEDAEEILFRFKEEFEGAWSKGWDDESEGKVQFVGFFDGKKLKIRYILPKRRNLT